MNKWGISGTGRSNIIVSNRYFHSRIIEKNSQGKKKFFNFPLLLFRKDSREGFVWKNKLFFPIHFHFPRYIIPPMFPKTRVKAKNQLLQFAVQKEKGAHDVHEKVPQIQDMIKEKDITIRKVVHSIQTVIYTLMGKNFLRSSTTPVIRNSVFLPARRSQIPLNQVYPGNGVSGKIFSDGNAVFWSISALNLKSFVGLTVNLNSHLIAPSDSVFDSGPVLARFSGKEAYHQVPKKELVFNSTSGLRQELEREMEVVKEELSQAEEASKANYSSIYSKMEEELKKLEINRISEQVIQQIVRDMKIEKERRGLL
ncbi:MAG: hypothetical protein NC238_05165 [Dehalobacter sp.]|nr:hypothetical protein [Dehalobacter sp.]